MFVLRVWKCPNCGFEYEERSKHDDEFLCSCTGLTSDGEGTTIMVQKLTAPGIIMGKGGRHHVNCSTSRSMAQARLQDFNHKFYGEDLPGWRETKYGKMERIVDKKGNPVDVGSMANVQDSIEHSKSKTSYKPVITKRKK